MRSISLFHDSFVSTGVSFYVHRRKTGLQHLNIWAPLMMHFVQRPMQCSDSAQNLPHTRAKIYYKYVLGLLRQAKLKH